MDVFAAHGPPLFVTLAAYAGWKPKPKAASSDLFGPEDLANFLTQFPGGDQVAPPPDG